MTDQRIVSVSVHNTSKTADRVLHDINNTPVNILAGKSRDNIHMDYDMALRLRGVGEGGAPLKVTAISDVLTSATTSDGDDNEHNDEIPPVVVAARNLLASGVDAMDLTELKQQSGRLLGDQYPKRATRASIISALQKLADVTDESEED